MCIFMLYVYMFICIYRGGINSLKPARPEPRFGRGPIGKGPDPVGPRASLGLGLGQLYTQFQPKLALFPPTKPPMFGGFRWGGSLPGTISLVLANLSFRASRPGWPPWLASPAAPRACWPAALLLRPAEPCQTYNM